MGGGALLTPADFLVFKVSPLTAISSDLLTSLVMQTRSGRPCTPRRRTVHWRPPAPSWCWVASPAGFLGAVIVGMLGKGQGRRTG
ncbi:hypothetical protein HBB16_19920 [Pseudonocardia sp. MCCB 268]|nr:hypothetical protein [Pseudonocardia cytotoxica]